MSDPEQLLRELAEEWGDVYVCRRDEPLHDENADRYCVRNHTDEGLGAKELKSAYGHSLTEALQHALAGDYSSPWSDGDGRA